MTASFRSPRRRWPVLGLALAVGVSTVPASAAALQEAESTLRIRVVEEGGGDPVPGAWARAWSETDRAGLVSTDAHGRARWRGLDPGRWSLAVRCPAGRRWLSTRRLLEVELELSGGADTTVVIRKPADHCREPPLVTRTDTFSGHFTHGFESSTFHPDRPFGDLAATLYEDAPMEAWVSFTATGRESWKEKSEGLPLLETSYPCYAVRWSGELTGPGEYGHMGLALYRLDVSDVLELRLVKEERCSGSPHARAHHQVVFHPGEGRALLLGGSTRRGEGYHYFDDVWAWNGSRWILAGRLPFRRSSHRAVHHGTRNSILLFGGTDGQEVEAEGILWERRNGDWVPVARRPRAGRAEPGMCYDAGRDRLVLFGGWPKSGGELAGSTWEWNGERLRRVARSGPVARAGHAFVYDPAREACLLFGGRGESGYLDDTWQWSDRGWRELDVEGPSPRWFFGAATDRRDGRVVIFGGQGPDGDLGDTWAWDGEAWRRVAETGPPPRSMAKMAAVGEGVLLFGGRSLDGGLRDWGDTWILVGARWTRLAE